MQSEGRAGQKNPSQGICSGHCTWPYFCGHFQISEIHARLALRFTVISNRQLSPQALRLCARQMRLQSILGHGHQVLMPFRILYSPAVTAETGRKSSYQCGLPPPLETYTYPVNHVVVAFLQASPHEMKRGAVFDFLAIYRVTSQEVWTIWTGC